MKKYYYIIILLICVACNEESKITSNYYLTKNIIEKSDNHIGNEQAPFLWFSDYQLIALENKKDFMLSDVRKIEVFNDKYYVLNGGAKPQVYIFSSDGHCNGKIGKFGHGRGEYENIYDICINREESKLLLLTYGNRVNIYDLNGKFLDSKIIIDDCKLEKMVCLKDKYYATPNHQVMSEKNPYLIYCFDKKLNLINGMILSDQKNQTTPPITTNYMFSNNKYVIYFDFYNHNFIKINNEEDYNVSHICFDIPLTYDDYNDNSFFEKANTVGHINDLCCIDDKLFGYAFIDGKSHCFLIDFSNNRTYCVANGDVQITLSGVDGNYIYSIISPEVLIGINEENTFETNSILARLCQKNNFTIKLTDNFYLLKMKIKDAV